MDDDTDGGWDLQAVVRGCAAPTNPSLSLADQINDQNNNDNHVNFQDLQDAYLEFCGDPPSATDIHGATDAVSLPRGHNVFQILRMNNANEPSQENMQFNNNNNDNNNNNNNPQPIRQRRRKTQQTKIVRQMTQEELSADSWAWRKYGQKPIKGSPYPRNYYRCNTSKGCAARKQVERSSIIDPGLFVVSYTGEHTHSRPTHHRSSLPGSTLPKSSTAAGSNNSSNNNNNNNKLLSARFSPGPPLETSGNDNLDMVGEEEEEDENIFMISNRDDGDVDMFQGFHDSDHDHSSGGGDFYTVPTANAHRVRS